jgi:glutathione S-transferase
MDPSASTEESDMKLYCHPASTTSRPIMLFAAENDIPLEIKVVDLFTGEHMQAPFAAINPNRLVPVLEDDAFVLTESSAILKYVADKAGSALYPKDLKARARVNERMDWINTQICRDLAYGFVYPQIFPHHKRRSSEAHDATLEWGKERAERWLRVLEDHVLRADPYLCGPAMTIADYYGASFMGLCEVTGSDLSAYPNVKAWLGRMKQLKTWKKINEAIDGFAASLKGNPMRSV